MVEAEPEEAYGLLRTRRHRPCARLRPRPPCRARFSRTSSSRPLVEDSYDVILPADHPLAKRSKLSLCDLADEPWIASTLANGCRRITEEVCRQAGFEPRVAFEADDTTRLPGARGRRGGRHADAAPRAHRRPSRRGGRRGRRPAPAKGLGRPPRDRLPLPRERGDAADPRRRGRGVHRDAARSWPRPRVSIGAGKPRW